MTRQIEFIHLGVAFLLLCGSAGAQTNYRDPQGRFTVTIPDGWNLQSNNGRVQLSSGPSYAVLTTGSGIAQPADVVNFLAGQFQKQYQNFRLSSQNTFKAGPHDAAFGIFFGTNGKGEDVVLELVGISAGGDRYLAIIASAPRANVKEASQSFSAIVQSVKFGGE
jgi:hypothetical protein